MSPVSGSVVMRWSWIIRKMTSRSRVIAMARRGISYQMFWKIPIRSMGIMNAARVRSLFLSLRLSARTASLAMSMQMANMGDTAYRA